MIIHQLDSIAYVLVEILELIAKQVMVRAFSYSFITEKISLQLKNDMKSISE